MSLSLIICIFLAVLYLVLGLVLRRKVRDSEQESAERLRYRVDEIIHTSRSGGPDPGR